MPDTYPHLKYYRNLYAKNEGLKEEIENLEEQRQEVYEKVRDMYDRKDEAREKFLNMDEWKNLLKLPPCRQSKLTPM